jgi:predicted O-linked N-acetylglucosamine transferase (SPINDLY family)
MIASNSNIQNLILSAQEYIAAKDLKSAARALRDAASLEPWRKEPLILLASVEALEGKVEESIELLGAASIVAPTDRAIFTQLGAALTKANRFAEAAGIFLQIHELDSHEPGSLHNAGVCFQRSHQIQRAEETLTRVTESFPDWAEGHRTLSTLLREQNRFEDALRHLLRATEIQPDQSRDLIDLGAIYARVGQLPTAIDCFKRGYLLDPQSRSAFDNLLTSALCDSRLRRHDIESLFKRADALHPRPISPLETHPRSAAEPRKVRIGFVSPDLHRHAVTSFLLPLIKELSRDRFEIVILSNSRKTDAITLRIHNLVHHWEDISMLSDAVACERVRELGVNALVDLTGHFQSNRLGIFALRAAPVQITMIGCMSTTGLAEMDYRITDAGLDPLGDEVWGSEELVRLDCGAVCLEEPDLAPEVGPLPATRNGYITFGSFNNLAKVGPEVLQVWATTLKSVPESRLHIVAEQGSRIIERLGVHGIAPSRITVLNRMPEPEYLAAHQQIDILLDTFPYNGFTITLLGAFMGVPCLTCHGEIPSARTAATVMSRLGLERFAASRPSGIPSIAASLCSDLTSLASIRTSLRATMRKVWMDAPSYAAEFSNWLIKTLQTKSSPLPVRPEPDVRQSQLESTRRNTLREELLKILNSPSVPSKALEEILRIADKSGLDDVGAKVAQRLLPRDTSDPLVALRLFEATASTDKARAIEYCLESGWHLRSAPIAKWLWARIRVKQNPVDLTRALIDCWADSPECPPDLLLERAKEIAKTSHDWTEISEGFLTALSRGSNAFDTWMSMAYAATSRRPVSDVLDCVRKALIARPGDPTAIAFLGGVLNEAGEHQSASLCTTIAIRVFPNQGAYVLSHSLALEKLFRLDEAVFFAEKALALMPHNPEAYKHLAFCEIRISRADRAVRTLREASRRFPSDTVIFSNMLYCENYVSQPDDLLFEKHCLYQSHLESFGVSSLNLTPKSVKTHGRLRIGVVSGDFRKHSVSYFVKPWLRHLDRSRFETVLFDTGNTSDETTEEFRSMSDHWITANTIKDEEFAELLRAEELDVVCELSGHTQSNRLGALARRCAPLQVTLIGAMQTTGLKEMDVRLSDAWMDPPGTTEQFHTEQLVRLKHGGWVFEPPAGMPEVQALPAFKNGYVTFGSFNNTAKITTEVLDAWAAVMHQVKKSRLLLNGFHFPTIRDALVRRGIDSSRLEFIGRPAGADYYTQHHRVDIALDTFPFNGLTVTCFAAWMGVPTLSHPEVRPASRVGYAIANRLGISDEIIAPNRASLPHQAVKLASDWNRLAVIRSELRQRAMDSIASSAPWVGELSDFLQSPRAVKFQKSTEP